MGIVQSLAVLLWSVFELGLLIGRRSKAKVRRADSSSLRYIWLVILAGNSSGIYFGMARIGYLPSWSAVFYWSGIALILGGVVFRAVAILQLKKFFTVDVVLHEDHRLIRSGLYRILRHPSYSGSLLSFVGLGISFSNWLSTLVISLPILCIFLFRIRIEEAALQSHFGQEYLDYMAQTKRLVPGIY